MYRHTTETRDENGTTIHVTWSDVPPEPSVVPARLIKVAMVGLAYVVILLCEPLLGPGFWDAFIGLHLAFGAVVLFAIGIAIAEGVGRRRVARSEEGE